MTRIIVNPAAGGGRAKAWAESLTDDRLHIELAESADQTREVARDAAERGEARVVAVGGDGTLNLVARELAFSETALGCVPLGTGNDWARSAGVSDNADEALEQALTMAPVRIDMARAEGQGLFLNVAGVGFDAAVAASMADEPAWQRKLGPTISYQVAALKTIISFKSPNLRVRIDGEMGDIEGAILLAVGVNRFYGAGMMILPNADPTDGLLDVAWGEGIGKLELPGLVKSIYAGEHLAHPKVSHTRCRTIEIDATPEAYAHLDGDVVGSTPIRFESEPGAILAIAPGLSG